MSLLDGYNELDEASGMDTARLFLNNIEAQDTPAFFQAWYDVFMENFEDLPNDQKITYLNTLKMHLPKYRIGHNVYQVGTTCIFPSEISYYMIDAVQRRLQDYVEVYIMTDKKNVYDTKYILNMTLLWLLDNFLEYPLVHKIYAKPYLILNAPKEYDEPIEIHTKYQEIRENIERLLDIKIKRGELE